MGSDQAMEVDSGGLETLVIPLLRAVLAGERSIPASVRGDLRPEPTRLMAWSERQQMLPLVVEGLLRLPGMAATEEGRRLACRAGAYAAHSAEQMAVVGALLDAFETAGVEHMPLKGILLKEIYPLPEWRVMGDADILVRVSDRERIAALLRKMGYTEGRESDHEYLWCSPEGVRVELHKSLVPTYDGDLYAYFGDGWGRARRAAGYLYRRALSSEDAYIYLAAHMAKHYRDGGVGIKYALDLYLFRRTQRMDEAYLSRELATVGIAVFEAGVIRLCRAWFEDGATDAVTRRMAVRLLSDGVYGDAQRAVVAESARLSDSDGRGACRRRWRRVLFPSYEDMCRRRGGRVPGKWCLPYLWMARWGELVLFRRGRCRRKARELARLSDRAAAAHREELSAVGLSGPTE